LAQREQWSGARWQALVTWHNYRIVGWLADGADVLIRAAHVGMDT